jgi:hypothetical protein
MLSANQIPVLVESQRASRDRIADIAAYDFHLTGGHCDDDVTMTCIVAVVLMVVVNAALPRPAHQIADARADSAQTRS